MNLTRQFQRHRNYGWVEVVVNGRPCLTNGHMFLPGRAPGKVDVWCWYASTAGQDFTGWLRRKCSVRLNRLKRVTVVGIGRSKRLSRRIAHLSNGHNVNANYLALIEAYCGPLEWFHNGVETQPLVGKRDGRVWALLMPRDFETKR